MATYDSMKLQDSSNIRKSLGGAFFLADGAADAITTLTTYTAAVTGPPIVPEKIELTTLPSGYEDIGYTTDDGFGFENDTSQSDVSSFQSTQPTRSDILTDTDTLTVVAQETKMLTIGLYTGADLSAVTLATANPELAIAKPDRPSARYWRGLVVAVDGEGDNEFFIARFYPKLKVTGKVGQKYGKGDDPISYGVTFTAFTDSTLGYSCKYLFGGLGWKARATAMGFTLA